MFGYGNPRQAVKRHVKDIDVTKRDMNTTKGRRSAIFVSEPGMYDLARKSKMPIANRFYDKVTHEILPAIRKNGFYSEGSSSLKSKDLVASDDVAQMLIQAGSTILELNEKVEAMTPGYSRNPEVRYAT